MCGVLSGRLVGVRVVVIVVGVGVVGVRCVVGWLHDCVCDVCGLLCVRPWVGCQRCLCIAGDGWCANVFCRDGLCMGLSACVVDVFLQFVTVAMAGGVWCGALRARAVSCACVCGWLNGWLIVGAVASVMLWCTVVSLCVGGCVVC